MSPDAILLAVVIAWPLIGISLSLVLGRRGHDPGSWLLVGALFGPFAVLLAVDSVEHDERAGTEVVAPPVHHWSGTLDVLVGVDGSPGSMAALDYVEHVLDGRIDRLTLATAVPYDGGLMDEREARDVLEGARRAARHSVGLEVVRGRPGVALRELARREGYDLLVVGTSDDERSHLLGDAAIDLARCSSVPVMLVPAERGAQHHAATAAAGAAPTSPA